MTWKWENEDDVQCRARRSHRERRDFLSVGQHLGSLRADFLFVQLFVTNQVCPVTGFYNEVGYFPGEAASHQKL